MIRLIQAKAYQGMVREVRPILLLRADVAANVKRLEVAAMGFDVVISRLVLLTPGAIIRDNRSKKHQGHPLQSLGHAILNKFDILQPRQGQRLIMNSRYTLLACISNSMVTTAMRRANSGDSTSQEQSLDKDSWSDEVLSEEEDDVSKETRNMVYIGSGAFQIDLFIFIITFEVSIMA
nr:nuclear transcription factor Y subunit A-9-like [Tanacetum cinerariifolium]